MLGLGVALGLRRGLGQRVRQGGLRLRRRRRGRVGRRGGGGGGRGGGGGVYLAVDGRHAAGSDGDGGGDELPAEAQQAAGDLVDVERSRFRRGGAGAGGRRALR